MDNINIYSAPYKHGYADALYGWSYLNPYYNEQELKEWLAGWMAGKKELAKNKRRFYDTV